jgi:hypothetical protein
MNRQPKTFRKLEVEAVVRRISENDASNGVLALESNGVLHGVKLLNSPQQRHDEIGQFFNTFSMSLVAILKFPSCVTFLTEY